MEGKIRVNLDYAPEKNGKEFDAWCEKYGFDPLGSGRRAWCSQMSTYFRGAAGIATTVEGGETFLFYKDEVETNQPMTKNTCCEKCAVLSFGITVGKEPEAAPTYCIHPTCPCHSSPDNWDKLEKQFDEEFAGLTLGILSDPKDSKSPAFHNNELEVPRLKNFLREKLSAHHALIRERLEGMRRRTPFACKCDVTNEARCANCHERQQDKLLDAVIDQTLSALDELKI